MLLFPFLLALLSCLCAAVALAPRAALTQVSDFGDNPTGLNMYVYAPENLGSSPGLVITLHGASGNGEQAFSSTPYADLAEQYGFVAIYPETPQGAWDATSRKSVVRDGGGDSQGVASMVKYAISAYNADASKVFVSGISSGGTMTNTMAGVYPDIFSGAIIYSAGSSGDIQDMYPGYTGSYPKVQLYLGSEDRVIGSDSFNITLAAWAQVHGYDTTPVQTNTDTPTAGWTTYVFGDRLSGIWAEGEGHPVFIQGEEDMKWWGFSR